MTDDIVVPILRTIQADLAALNRKVSAQGHDLSDVKQNVRMIRAAIRDMGETRVTEGEITVLHEDVNRVQQRLQDLELRVEELEDHRPD
jgi:chromosome segregation ATPase